VSNFSSIVSVSGRVGWLAGRPGAWMRTYVRQLVVADFGVAIVAAIAAIGIRFGLSSSAEYLVLSLVLPLLWIIALRIFGGDPLLPEIDGAKLRTPAWELEKTGTDLCVAPALLDVAGPRTTVRPTAGLTLLLVGPRPALPEETARYADHVRRRLVVKPGLTGMWQVNGRSDLPWEETVRLDLRYVENWSLALDVQILWKTLAVVLKGSGAY
jgi:hypothetical protein